MNPSKEELKEIENDAFGLIAHHSPPAPVVKYKKVLYCNKCKLQFLDKNQEYCPKCNSYDLGERNVRAEEPPYK